MEKTTGIAVHVDTFAGMQNGVPVLLDLFRKYHVYASFFVPMGKDHTGRTVKRIFTRKDFLKKTGTGRVWATATSPKTLMYGLVIPGPEIARRNRGIIGRIIGEGHELGIHGYDHVFWHDHIKTMSRQKTEREVDKLLSAYKELTGVDALSFAAPGWMTNPHALRYMKQRGLVYTSDTRMGSKPFMPVMAGEHFDLLQIPTTLPTLDEVVGSVGEDMQKLADHYMNLMKADFNILTVHAEIEGGKWTGFLERVLKRTLDDGFFYKRLIDIAEEIKLFQDITRSHIEYGFVEGRAGEVCLQA